MAKIRIVGDSSGYVELAAPNVAENNTLELPSNATKLVGADASNNLNVTGIVTATGGFSGNINSTGVSTITTLRSTSIVGVTTAGITTAYIGSVNNGPISGFKNLIINGGFDIWQRGTSFSTNAAYTADRWWLVNDSVGTATVTRQDISSQGLGSQYCLRAERSSGTNRWTIGTQLETSTVKSVLGKTITLSFYIRKGTALTSNVVTTLATSATEEKFGTQLETASLTISNSGMSTTSFTKYSTSLNVGAASTALGIKIEFEANQAGASNAYFEIAQVQLEEGPVASVFERRPYGQELALAQRYYQEYIPGAQELIYSESNGASGKFWQVLIRVPMRIAPNVTFSSGITGGAVVGLTGTVSSLGVEGVTVNRVSVRVNMSGNTGSANAMYHCDTFANDPVYLNAEL